MLTNKQFSDAAQSLNSGVAAVKAVNMQKPGEMVLEKMVNQIFVSPLNHF
jgi:hypothetical protein